MNIQPVTSTPSRRDFLKQISAAAAGTQFLGMVTQSANAGQLPGQKNILLLMTDQERPPIWFPAGWEAANFPTLTRLKSKGLTFDRAFCCTSMCSPSRNSLFTGLFPAQHGATDCLTSYVPQC